MRDMMVVSRIARHRPSTYTTRRRILNSINHVALDKQICTSRRSFSIQARGYAEALGKLELLHSNRQTTTLFEAKESTSANVSSLSCPPGQSHHHARQSTNHADATVPSRRALNADAIPGMLRSLRQAGYSPSDLARMRHIHVAGTKGKGSVCAFATSLLRRHGVTVGTYTSPHLVSPRERIAIDGQPMEKDVFSNGVFELWDRYSAAAAAADKQRREEEAAAAAVGENDKSSPSRPFYFRFMTILAWHLFLQMGIKDVIMECGIGGEYDATNVLPAEAVSAGVITQLGIDHVAMLGGTVEEIAWHKAGIMKPGVPCFTRKLANRPTVMEVLRSRAAEKGAELVQVDDQSVVQTLGGIGHGLLQGDFQLYNQSLAVLAVLEHLGDARSRNPEKALRQASESQTVKQGLQDARLRGRCEVIEQREATYYLDGAHTTESIEHTARWFVTRRQETQQQQQQQRTAILVFNQQERDASQLLTSLIEAMKASAGPDQEVLFHHAIFTRNEQTNASGEGRAHDLSVQTAAAATMQSLLPSCQVHVSDCIQHTVDLIHSASTGVTNEETNSVDLKPMVLVTGSLHLVGGLLQHIEPELPR